MAYQKLALKRDPDAPAGQPAEMHVDCPCGQEVIIISNDNACDCGAVYDGAGWVKRSSVASHTETALATSDQFPTRFKQCLDSRH